MVWPSGRPIEGFGAAALDDQSVERLEKAIKLHERHLAVADAGGRFAALTMVAEAKRGLLDQVCSLCKDL